MLPITHAKGRESPFLDVVSRRAPVARQPAAATRTTSKSRNSSSLDPGTQSLSRESASAEGKTRPHARLRLKAATAMSTAKSSKRETYLGFEVAAQEPDAQKLQKGSNVPAGGPLTQLEQEQMATMIRREMFST